MNAPRVLLVDDNAINIELVRFVLDAAGFTFDAVADARHALANVAEFAPDVVLMDIQMPGIDGLELTRRIKADAALRHVAVVAFTAYAMKGDEARMRAAGCDGYLSKPIDVARFAAQVRAFLPDENRAAPA
jgi:CheY-like chemotaxis protein